MQKWYKSLILVMLLLIVLLFVTNYSIIKHSSYFVKQDFNEFPALNTGLLLGTSKLLRSGKENAYFFNRITATVELYNSKKIKRIIISGDNSEKDYNEPLDMKNELIKYGIPDSVIYLDYAGLRTFDSVIRAKEIFGQESYIVISQKFHNERAIYIARKNGIQAYGYSAKDVNKYAGLKTNIREYFARLKVFIDIYCGIKPKFLGDKIVISN